MPRYALAIGASGAIVSYIHRTQKAGLERLQGLHTYSPRAFMLPGPPDPQQPGAVPGRKVGQDDALPAGNPGHN